MSKDGNLIEIQVPTLAELQANGKQADLLLWVGCAGAYDDQYKKVSRNLVKILASAKVNFAVLGTEESCSGDPARRAGNEFLFQMQAMQNIKIINDYGIKDIITACPHCYNTLKNEYVDFGGYYNVMHHSTFIIKLIKDGRIKIRDKEILKTKSITYHDACYLGRGNGIYDDPRAIINKISNGVREMKRNKSRSFCCGAGGAQMFKVSEPGEREVYEDRSKEALELHPDIIATACPFCMTMLNDGVKHFKKEEVKVMDLADLVALAAEL